MARAGLGRLLSPWSFYFFSLFVGGGFWLVSAGQHTMFRLLAGSDAFFTCFILYVLGYAFRLQPDDLRRRHRREWVSVIVMLATAAAAVLLSLVAIFTLLNHPHSEGSLFPAFAISSVPLSWAIIHCMAAHMYTRLYYSQTRSGVPEGGLVFPGDGEPSGVDFLYYAMVIGTSASVSDVTVVSRDLRVATMVHSLISFSFNTVLIAIAVNAAMTLA